MAGERWGEYLVGECIGRGGMGEVFLAQRLGAQNVSLPVCIKRMHSHLTDNPGAVALFHDEAKNGQRLNHRNIVTVTDFREHDGQYFIVMELVRGESLKRVEERLAANDLVMRCDLGFFIALELLKALEFAHTARDLSGDPLNIVHRDVCPHNVLLSHSGEVKLADFGIARAAQQSHHTAADVVRGRRGYMPIEQFSGNADLDARADLYALGVTLFEMFTGRRPFGDGDVNAMEPEVIAAQVNDDRVSLSALRDDLPETLRDLIDRMLAKDPMDRPASATEALDALESAKKHAGDSRSLQELMSSLYPGNASLMEATSRSTARQKDVRRSSIPKIRRVSNAPKAFAATRPSLAIVPDSETAPPSTLDASREREAHPSSTRVPVWLVAIVASVFMGGAAFVLSRTRRGPDNTSRIAATAALTPDRSVTLVPSTPAPVMVPAVVAPIAAPATNAPDSEPTPRSPVVHRAATPVSTEQVRVAPARPAIATGTLRVLALPWGDVFVDGTARGRSPLNLSVSAGEHVVRISGGVEHTERVVVTAGATRTVRAEAE